MTDLKRRKQWPTTPQNVGHRRDFYRLSDAQPNPLAAEEALSRVESVAAPVLKELFHAPLAPYFEQLEILVYFMATQWARSPRFRPWMLRLEESIFRTQIGKVLENRDAWIRTAKKIGIDPDSPKATYEEMLKFKEKLEAGGYTATAETEFYIERGFTFVNETCFPALLQRAWETVISPSGSFIGCDNPVILEGPKGSSIGFASAEIIAFPVNRHMTMFGTNNRVRPPFVNRKFIARVNTRIMLAADEQIYSHIPNYCWLDSNNEVRNDWEGFNPQKILDSINPYIIRRK